METVINDNYIKNIINKPDIVYNNDNNTDTANGFCYSIHYIANKLENKMMQYTKDINIHSNIENISLLINNFNEENKYKFFENIISFIYDNDNKIRHILTENKNRIMEMPFLLCPEIFIVFWGLDNCMFSITDNKNEVFTNNEIEIIRNLWYCV